MSSADARKFIQVERVRFEGAGLLESERGDRYIAIKLACTCLAHLHDPVIRDVGLELDDALRVFHALGEVLNFCGLLPQPDDELDDDQDDE